MQKSSTLVKSLLKKSLILVLVLIVGFIINQTQNAEAETTYPYLIKVNRKMCTVTVYEKDEKGKYTIPVRAMICSPGWDTPLGTFRTPERHRWRLLVGDVWGQYCTRINKGVLFHSVWYYEKDPTTLSNSQFNKLGSVCSHGCVRLTVEDAKWIYDNCPIGTTVTIYDSNNPGPLGKPEGIKVSTKTVMGYDPTDIWSEGNPYVDQMPRITGVKNATVQYAAKVDLKNKVKAYSSTGVDISSKVTVSIKFQGKKVKKIDSKTEGAYYVTYAITDPMNRKAKAEAIYKVVDNTKPVFYGVKNKYYNDASIKVDYDLVTEDVWAEWHGEELDYENLMVEIVKSKASTETLKEYDVSYLALAPNGKSATKKCKVVIDLVAPELSGVTNREISVDTVVDEAFVLEGVTALDNVTVAKVGIRAAIEKISDVA